MSLPPLFEPYGLPLFLADGHAIDPDDVYSDFPRGSGENRKRRLATTAPRRVSVARMFTPAQMVVYDDWFETNIVVGETHFSSQIANIEGPAQLWFDSCWLAPYVATPVATPHGTFWRIVGSLLLTGDGTSVRPDNGTLAVEYSAFLRGVAAVGSTFDLAVEYAARLESAMLLAVEYAAGLDSTITVFLAAPTQVTLSGLAPAILRGAVAAPGAGAITVAGRAPTVLADIRVLPGAGAITVAGQAPSTVPIINTVLTPGSGAITITGQAPTPPVLAGVLDAYLTNKWGVYSVIYLLDGSYSGPLFRVRNTSGGAETDIGFDPVTGVVDLTALAAAAAGGTLTVKTLYDQSGLGHDITQSTTGSQPRIVNAGTFDKGAVFDGTDDFALTPTLPTGPGRTILATYDGLTIPATATYSLFETGVNFTFTGIGWFFQDNVTGPPNNLHGSRWIDDDGSGQRADATVGGSSGSDAYYYNLGSGGRHTAALIVDRTQSVNLNQLKVVTQDGAVGISAGPGATSPVPSNDFASHTLSIAARNGSSLFCAVKFQSIVIYTAAKSTADMTAAAALLPLYT